MFSNDQSTAALDLYQVRQLVPRNSKSDPRNLPTGQQPTQRGRGIAATSVRVFATQHDCVAGCLGTLENIFFLSKRLFIQTRFSIENKFHEKNKKKKN